MINNITPIRGSSGLVTGGEPPQDGGMSERVARLEERLEAVLPTLGTKSDLAELRADVAKGQTENRAWMLATVIALFGAVLLVGNFIASNLKTAVQTSAPPQAAGVQPTLQPIIIQLPGNSQQQPQTGLSNGTPASQDRQSADPLQPRKDKLP